MFRAGARAEYTDVPTNRVAVRTFQHWYWYPGSCSSGTQACPTLPSTVLTSTSAREKDSDETAGSAWVKPSGGGQKEWRACAGESLGPGCMGWNNPSPSQCDEPDELGDEWIDPEHNVWRCTRVHPACFTGVDAAPPVTPPGLGDTWTDPIEFGGSCDNSEDWLAAGPHYVYMWAASWPGCSNPRDYEDHLCPSPPDGSYPYCKGTFYILGNRPQRIPFTEIRFNRDFSIGRTSDVIERYVPCVGCGPDSGTCWGQIEFTWVRWVPYTPITPPW